MFAVSEASASEEDRNREQQAGLEESYVTEARYDATPIHTTYPHTQTDGIVV
jgi:hypothetical protein